MIKKKEGHNNRDEGAHVRSSYAVRAPGKGVITAILTSSGATVEQGEKLMVMQQGPTQQQGSTPTTTKVTQPGVFERSATVSTRKEEDRVESVKRVETDDGVRLKLARRKKNDDHGHNYKSDSNANDGNANTTRQQDTNDGNANTIDAELADSLDIQKQQVTNALRAAWSRRIVHEMRRNIYASESDRLVRRDDV
jgi:pyruvate/2-oxoglutarate dehydrogenase complex dihydrolipoamide acyltransferase (E2) component